MKCIKCSGSTVAGTTDHEFNVGIGRQFVVTMPASVCEGCGDAYVNFDVLGEAEHQVARRLAESGEPTGASFRFMRKTLGIPAATLAAELGIAVEAILEWEKNDLAVDPATWLLLAGMAREPNGEDGEIRRLLRAHARWRSGEMPPDPGPIRFELKRA